MHIFSALVLLVALAGCGRETTPPPPPVEFPARPDTAGVPGPTADEIDAGAGILRDALKAP